MLIRGGRIVDVDGDRVGDLRVGADGTVASVGLDLLPLPGEEIIDAAGRLVVPGGVDAHTHLHLRVGDLEVSDDFATGTAAAAVGGTTTVLEYVTPKRGQDVEVALADWRQRACASAVDYGFHLTIVDAVDEQVIEDAMAAGITSFKLYMAYPDSLMVDDGVILDVLRATGKRGGLVTVHAENGGAISSLQRQALQDGRRGVIEHSRTRPAVLEGEATSRAALLAEMAGAPLYIVHLSSAPALEAVRKAQERGVSVTAETCPQYLHLHEDRLEGPDGDAFVCTPPLRDAWHGEELWYGLAAGWLHTVATDHCPWWMHDRRQGLASRPEGWRDFTEIPGGLPGIETRLALVWAGVVDGRLRAADWVRLCAEAPARSFGLWPRKGNLRVGADADVVVWDPLRDQGLGHEQLHMQVDFSPYEHMTSHGWPEHVFLRGAPVAREGRFVGAAGGGQYLSRGTVPHP